MIIYLANIILFALIPLFAIRLYVTNQDFARLVNKLFDLLDNYWQYLLKLKPNSVKSLFKAVSLILGMIMAIILVATYDLWTAFFLVILIIFPGFPLYIYAVKQAQFDLTKTWERQSPDWPAPHCASPPGLFHIAQFRPSRPERHKSKK